MHKGIVAHPTYLDRSQAGLLEGLDFVFVSVDSGSARRAITTLLHEQNKAFIDVGMGIEVLDDTRELVGQLRVSTSTPTCRGSEARMPVSDIEDKDDYSKNIQIADLNCLNAALAVVRWKKLCGFYQDRECEHFAAYAVNVNQLVSEDAA
jgi:hypothetical protein